MSTARVGFGASQITQAAMQNANATYEIISFVASITLCPVVR